MLRAALMALAMLWAIDAIGAPAPWYRRPLPATAHSSDLSVGPLTWMQVASPACHAPGRCPVLLVVGGGAQTRHLVEEGLRPWAQAWRDAGWRVLSPIATSREQLFHEAGTEHLLAFVDEVVRPMLGGRPLWVLGVSNGGIAGFRLAAARPDIVARLVAAPGYLDDAWLDRAERLRGVHVALVIGGNDRWRAPAARTQAALRAAGVHVTACQLPERGHAAILDVEWTALEPLLARGERPALCGSSEAL